MVNYHPYVLAINEGNYQAAAELEIARSSFDPFIEQKTKSRVSGYYDGTNLTQRFTNPIEDYNASVFGEYRIAGGDFPSYEGYYDTLSGGEASVGIAMSLLQNREIDKRRTALRNAGLASSQWQALASSLINDFVYKGVSEYIAWYESALQIDAVTELLNTAFEREKALVTRVEKGDLASIVLTEFKANLLQQRLTLAELKQKRDMHAQMLSFYWRSPSGDMQAVKSDKPPKDINWPYWVGNGQLVTLRNALREAKALAGASASAERASDALLTHADAMALAPVLSGEQALYVHVERASDIRAVLAIKSEFPALKLVLIGASEGWMVANEIAASGVPVLTMPLRDLPEQFEVLGATQSNVGRMVQAGVKVGIGLFVGDNQPRRAAEQAGNLVALTKLPGATGLTWAQAFAAITSIPAEISGMGGKEGVLAPGAVGDVVIWDGDPLEMTSAPVAVWIDGVAQPMTDRQTRLRDRYATPDEGSLPKAYEW